MTVHAYPTDATTPVDLAQAHRITERLLSDPDDLAAGITRVVTEFDTGFTVVAVRGAAPTEPGAPAPPTVGGSVCVIDKATGAVSYWPTYPPALVAEQYSAMLRAGGLVVAENWPDPDELDTGETAEPDPATDEVVIDYGTREGR
ncbi:hypothetical protein [Nocardia arizonensis]|uniref:hypothetical protein n=1 Tax=Nocardia arizonensis TaxID=1141647 RepID=UPI0006D2A6F4|nr:hypothetical protein [Nocardia arizonensis]